MSARIGRDGWRATSSLPGERRPLILTLDQTDRIETPEGTVEVRPAWKWMMSD
jgi:hypothetical protein